MTITSDGYGHLTPGQSVGGGSPNHKIRAWLVVGIGRLIGIS
jgi:hypothetical protein